MATEMRRLAQDAVNSAEYLDTVENLWEAIDTVALEIYANERRWANDRRVTDSVTVVLGTGGPHYQFTVRENGQVTGEAWGWFGKDRAEAHGTSEALAEVLFYLFEQQV